MRCNKFLSLWSVVVLVANVALGAADARRHLRVHKAASRAQQQLLQLAGRVEEYSWTEWVYQYGTVLCSNNGLVSGFLCEDSYCANVALFCHNQPSTSSGSLEDAVWTESTSVQVEGKDEIECPSDYFMTGIKCEGLKCEDISLHCSKFSAITSNDCAWTDWWLSEKGIEQNHYLDALAGAGMTTFVGYYVKGIKCRNQWCDDKAFQICTVSVDGTPVSPKETLLSSTVALERTPATNSRTLLIKMLEKPLILRPY